MGDDFKICHNQGAGSQQILGVEYQKEGGLDGSHCRLKRSNTDEIQEWLCLMQWQETKQTLDFRGRRYIRKTWSANAKQAAEALWPYCQGLRFKRREINQTEIVDKGKKPTKNNEGEVGEHDMANSEISQYGLIACISGD